MKIIPKINKKGYGGITVVLIIALFMFAFMFSDPSITGLVIENGSLHFNENSSLEIPIDENESMDVVLNINLRDIIEENK